MADESPIHEPLVLALVVCDAIHRDPANGKHYVLGTFSSIIAERYPATHPQLGVYIALTELNGKVPLLVRLVDVAEERDPIDIAHGEIVSDDPRMVAEVGLVRQDVTIPEPGEYRLQLWCGDLLLLERRLLALIAQQHEEP